MCEMIETLAAGIHEAWRALAAREGWKMQCQFDRPYAELASSEKEDNLAAARRIPEMLALAGMALARADDPNLPKGPTDAEIRTHLEQYLERLSEAEHDGWMSQRLEHGWRFGEVRDDEKKIHPLLIPYSELSESEKHKDRNSVRHLSDVAAMAGYRIVWLWQLQQLSLPRLGLAATLPMK